MKKKPAIVLVLVCLVVCTTLLFVACSGDEESAPNIEFRYSAEAKTEYLQGELFSLEGLTLAIGTGNGAFLEVPVTEAMLKEIPDLTTPGEKTVTVVYEGKEYSFTIEVTALGADVLADGRLAGLNLTYFAGDDFTLAGGSLVFGEKSLTLTDRMLKALPDMSRIGEQTLYVVYAGVEYPFTISVRAVEESAYAFTGISTFDEGDEFTFDGFNLVITYNNDTTKTLTGDDLSIVTVPDLTTAGRKSFVVSYGGRNYTYNFEIEKDELYETSTLLQKYLENRTLYKKSHGIDLRVLLQGSVNGFGTQLNPDVDESLLTLPVPKDAFLAYFQDAIAKALLEDTLREELTSVNGVPTAYVDVETLAANLTEAVKDATSDWDTWLDLFWDMQVENGSMSRGTASDFKAIKAKVKTLLDMSVEERANTSVYGYISILTDTSVEDIKAGMAELRDDIATYVLERNGFEELVPAFTHAMDAVCDLLEKEGVSKLSGANFAKAIKDATEEDMEVLADMYLIINLTSFAKTLAANKDKISISDEDYQSLYKIFTAIDTMIADGFSAHQMLLIADGTEELLISAGLELRELVLDEALSVVANGLTEFLPDYMTEPLLDMVSMIRDAFDGKAISEVDYVALKEGLIEKAEAFIGIFIEQYEDGAFTAVRDLVEQNEDYLKLVLSDDDYIAVLNIADAVDQMIAEGFDADVLHDLLNDLWDIKEEYLGDIPEAQIYEYVMMGLYGVQMFLPDKEGGIFEATADLFADYFDGMRLVNVAYVSFASEFLDLWNKEIARYIDEYENGKFTVFEDIFEKNVELLEEVLNKKEIEDCRVIMKQIDEMILSGYDADSLRTLLNALWDIKVNRVGDTPEKEIYDAVIKALTTVEAFLPEDMGKVFGDTADLIEEYFADGEYFSVDYPGFAERFLDLWTAECKRYGDLYAAGELSVLQDLFERYEDVIAEELTQEQVSAIKELLQAADQMIMTGFDEDEARAQFFAILAAFADDLNLTDEQEALIDLLAIWTAKDDASEKINGSIDVLKGTVAAVIARLAGQALDLGEEDTQELSSVLEGIMSEYISEDPDYSDELTTLLDLCTKKMNGEVNAGFNMAGLAIAIVADKLFGFDVDYNSIMDALPLPKEVESVDYNTLISRALDGKELADIFAFDMPTVTYARSENGDLAKAFITFSGTMQLSALPIDVDLSFALVIEIEL